MSSSALKDILVDLDQKILDALFVCHRKSRLPNVLYYLCLFCELSGHGVLWFVGVALTGILAWDAYTRNLSVFLFLLLVLDVLLVAPIKLYFKRARPTLNEGGIIMSVSKVDQYSFPSGHASRSVALAVYLVPWLPSHVASAVCMWAACVCVSRVLMGRHHPSDVIAGVAAGLVVAWCTKQLQALIDS